MPTKTTKLEILLRYASKAISEDIRKLGTTVTGVGLAAMFLTNTHQWQSLLVFTAGILLWLSGLLIEVGHNQKADTQLNQEQASDAAGNGRRR